MHEFKTINGIQILEKSENYYELFIFVSKYSNNITSFCINHFEILERFILYFREQGAGLIQAHERNKIIVPHHDPEYKKFLQQAAKNIYANENDLKSVYNELKLKKYPIIHNDKKIYLTPKEVHCIKHLAAGNSWKEIGNILQVSSRTVETHLENAKNKLGVYSKPQLLKAFRNSGLSIVV